MFIAWKRQPPAEEGWEGMDYCFLWQLTLSISLLPTPLFLFPFPQGKQREDSRSLRPRRPRRTAAPRTASAARRARPAPAAVRPNTSGAQLRSSTGVRRFRGLCADISFLHLKDWFDSFWKKKNKQGGIFLQKKKDWFSFGEATVRVSVCMCTQCMGKHSLLDLL